MSAKRTPAPKPQSFRVWAWAGAGKMLAANGVVNVYTKMPSRVLRPAFVRATLTLDPPKKPAKTTGERS